MVDINYLAVLLGGIAAMVIGSIWYGPLFGKQWIALMGWTPEQIEKGKSDRRGMMKNYGLMLVGALVTAYVLAHVLAIGMNYTETSGAAVGISTGFWMWLGFVAPVMLGKVLWEGKPWKLWVLDSGYYLVMLVVTGVILALM